MEVDRDHCQAIDVEMAVDDVTEAPSADSQLVAFEQPILVRSLQILRTLSFANVFRSDCHVCVTPPIWPGRHHIRRAGLLLVVEVGTQKT